MCYDVAYLTKKIEYYEKRFNASYGNIPFAPMYHSNGFDHMDLPVITNDEPSTIQMYSWGLIPAWVKDPEKAQKIQNQTLNARDDTLFEKPSFKHAAQHRRCLVLVDGFYDHHWKDQKSFPYYIQRKDRESFAMGGIWEIWRFKEMVRHTFSIITTDPNERMAWIHNRPRASEGPRMPFILNPKEERKWIDPTLSPQEVQDLIKPLPQEYLSDHTVSRLRGKAYPGNVASIRDSVTYQELSTQQGSLF
ncbi:MAG: SOS response-associated peptidase [Cyclobacteriaceae bacterium]|nr:SOS response-associated peptidase [Cyclobacteriaceae bacterium]